MSGNAAQMLDEAEAHTPDAALVQDGVLVLSERRIDYGDAAIPTETWQCASHASGGMLNRGAFVSGSGASQEFTCPQSDA